LLDTTIESQHAEITQLFFGRTLSKRIVLIDGTQLAKLMIRYNVGCRVEESLDIRKIDEEFFE